MGLPLHRTLTGLALAALVGCAAEPAPDEPPAPEDVWLGEAVSATVEVLHPGPVAFAAGLPGHRLLLQEPAGPLLELAPLAPEPVEHAAPAVASATPLAGGRALLTTAEGLRVLEAWGLEPSPLGAIYTPAPDARLLSAGDDLWIADDGLALWRDGSLWTIEPGDLPSADATLAYGSPVQGYPALWVAADDVVYALVSQGDDFVTWEEGGRLDAAALAVDAVDDLWAPLADGADPALGLSGDLRRRLPDGRWQWFRLPSPVTDLVAGSATWLVTDDGLVRNALDTWSAVDVALEPDDSLVSVDALGRLLVAGPTGLRRISVDRPVATLGLADGDAIEDLTTVSFLPSLSERAASLALTLDGTPLDASPVDLDPRRAWTTVLDPALLDDGAHELTVTVTWDDGHDDSVRSVFFSVGAFVPPGWAADIEPINAASCLSCHSPNGGAHLLDTRARWEGEIDGILDTVVSGAMPLSGDKLDAEQIRLIELWRAGGFAE